MPKERSSSDKPYVYNVMQNLETVYAVKQIITIYINSLKFNFFAIFLVISTHFIEMIYAYRDDLAQIKMI